MPGPEKMQPAGWAATATEEDWADLADWVDWLIVTYDFTLERTMHPGVAEELAALAPHGGWHPSAAGPTATNAK